MGFNLPMILTFHPGQAMNPKLAYVLNELLENEIKYVDDLEAIYYLYLQVGATIYACLLFEFLTVGLGVQLQFGFSFRYVLSVWFSFPSKNARSRRQLRRR